MILVLKISLVLVASLVAVSWPRWSAARRFFVGLTGVLCIPLVVTLHALIPTNATFEVPVPAIDTNRRIIDVVPEAVQSVVANQFAAEVPTTLPDLGTLLLIAYLVVALTLLGRLCLQVVLAHRWVKTGQRVDSDSTVPIVVLDSASSPFTWGLRRPVIVVPAQWRSWQPSRQRMVLLHEGAHIRRGDLLWSLTVRVICALVWIHPLIWWLAAKLRHEAERACDDCVVIAGVEAADYAEQLIKITRFTRPQVAPAMASKSKLSIRITELLDPKRRRMPMKSWQIWSTAVATLLLLTPIVSLSESSHNGLSAEIKAALQTAQDELSHYQFENAEQSVKALLVKEKLTAAEEGQVYNMLAYAHYLQNELPLAVEAYEQVIERQAAIPAGMYQVTLYTLAQLEFVSENYPAALAYIDAWFAQAKTPGPQPTVFRSKVLLALERYDEALVMMDQGIELAAANGRKEIPAWERLRTQLTQLAAGGESRDAVAKEMSRNRDYLPVVKVAPIYPADALANRVEGYVVVEFVVTETGEVAQASVFEAEPPQTFDEAALLAASKFKYKPQLIDGIATPVHGVRNRISFRLPKP